MTEEDLDAWEPEDDPEAERILAEMADVDWEDEDAARDALYHDKKRKLADYLFTPDMLDLLPPVEWLIDGILPLDALAVLYADAGVGKTFVALDWCASLSAAREDWEGYLLRPETRVLYIYAEGAPGLKKRRDAWQTHHEVRMTSSLIFLLRAANFLVRQDDTGDDDWSQLLEIVAQMQPHLIVVDTMSRAIPGADENDTGTMSFLMARSDDLREAGGWGTVLFLHHTNKAGTGYRGNSVIRGQVHTMIAIDEEGVLRVTKQRDDQEPTIGRLRLHPVEGTDSVVPLYESLEPVADDATVQRFQVVNFLRSNPASSTSALAKVMGATTEDARKVLVALEQEGLVEQRPAGRGVAWSIVEAPGEAGA